MKARELYVQLNNDFIKAGIKDVDWAARMPDLDQYLYPWFKQKGGMGLMCDFTEAIETVYTTVFLSDNVLSGLLSDDVSNAMLLSHHPTNWDLRNHGGNYTAEEKYIAALKERNISVYILHHPLDNFGTYSTCGTLADQLGITVERPAFLYYGAMCGIIGTTDCKTISELSARYSRAVGHKTSLYLYGNEDIRGERIALCPGGGNAMFVLNEMVENNIKTLITGVTIVNDHSREAHEYARNHRINILGGTHYSTEKYAPMEMCKYFHALGLPCAFIADEPDLFDL